MSHSRRAARALTHLAERDPALSLLALWCRHRDGPRTESRGSRIDYGPDFEALTLAEQIGLVGHHVLHVALRHSARQAELGARLGRGFDATLFNLAADALVNETLLLAEHGLARPAVTATGLLAAADMGRAKAGARLADWDVETLYLSLSSDAQQAARAAEYGRQTGWAADLGHDDPASGPGDATAADPADWQGRLAQAFAAGRSAGIGIGRIETRLGDLAPPRLAWERRLRGLMARALAVAPHPLWQRPANRWLAMAETARRAGTPAPVFEPKLRILKERPRLVVALDVSSSVDARMLRLFASEVAGLLRRTGTDAHLLTFDDAVRLDMPLSPGRALQQVLAQPLRTGGGTDFRPAIARASELAPAMMVVMTDLQGPTGAAPRFPVLWVVPGARPAPPFGRVIAMETGDVSAAC